MSLSAVIPDGAQRRSGTYASRCWWWRTSKHIRRSGIHGSRLSRPVALGRDDNIKITRQQHELSSTCRPRAAVFTLPLSGRVARI